MNLYRRHQIHLPVGCFLRRTQTTGKTPQVLVLCDDALGDLLILSGVLKYLKQQGFGLTLVIRDTWKELGPYLWVDRVLPVNLGLYRRSVRYRIDFLNKVRQEKYIWAAAALFPSAVNTDILKYSGALESYGYCYGGFLMRWGRLRVAHRKIKALDLNQTDQERTDILELLAHYYAHILNQPLTKQQIAPVLNMPSKVAMPALVRPIGPYLLYISDTAGKIRQYPVEKLIPMLEKYAQKHHLKVVVTAKDAYPGILDSPHIVNLTGKTSLLQLSHIIWHAQTVLGNETGATHLAWIMHKPTVMIYGGGHFGLFRPSNGCRLVHRQMPCFNCDWEDCFSSQRPAPCVSEIEVEAIEAALEEIS